jgi:hypothetical protein
MTDEQIKQRLDSGWTLTAIAFEIAGEKFAELQSEIESLKAKLDTQDAYLQSVLDSHLSLEQQLKDESWHDASELPTEEGKYIMGFIGSWKWKDGFHLVYNWASGGSQGSDYEQDYAIQVFTNKRDMESEIDGSWDEYGFDKNRKYFWKPITLPEGK